MSDAPELRTQVRRWFVETGWVDGNGVGLWDTTDESVEVASKAEADTLRDEWLSQGKIEVDRWDGFKRTGPYGAFRIRSLWEDATPGALAASPEVQALLREAEARGMERAAENVRSWREQSIHSTHYVAALLREAAAIRGEGK